MSVLIEGAHSFLHHNILQAREVPVEQFRRYRGETLQSNSEPLKTGLRADFGFHNNGRPQLLESFALGTPTINSAPFVRFQAHRMWILPQGPPTGL